jgi:ornithine carbamoyltransferase
MNTLIKRIGLVGQDFLAEKDVTDEQMLGLIDLAIALKKKKRTGNKGKKLLAGKNICMVFQKASTRTRCATVVASQDEGALVEYLGTSDIHFGKKESVADSARVLARMFDGIFFRGFDHSLVEQLAQHANVPVWNALTDQWHPTQILADLMTLKETFGRLKGLKVVYLGDGRNNVCNSLMVGCAKTGVNFVNCCPPELKPDPAVIKTAKTAAKRNGCTIEVIHDPIQAVKGANFLYTDVWASMGEESQFEKRLKLLRPYQVTMDLVRKTGNLKKNEVIFLHCLPAFHNHDTEITEKIGALEVTDEVFEAPFSKVFDEAENRMHTIKAMMVATLS